MVVRAAREWHNTYGIGEREANVVIFSSVRELTDFKARHGLKGETHVEAILRTARAIATDRKIHATYESGNPSRLIFQYLKK